MEDPTHCDVCVSKFVMDGGCECWMDDACDEDALVPEGCEMCAYEAAEACGIDMSSMEDDEVPMCDMRVLGIVMTMLSPECQGVLMAAVNGESNNADISCEECACYTEITPEGFFEATGVSADSC